MSLGTGVQGRKMTNVLYSLLPSVLVLLFITLILQAGKNEALALPISIPRPSPGSKLVVVVESRRNSNEPPSVTNTAVLSPTMATQESQIDRKRAIVLRKTPASSLEEIKRQGHLSKHASLPSFELNNKNEKSFLHKLLPSAPRHISSAPTDVFPFHKKFSSASKIVMPSEKHNIVAGSQIIDFRPHQPDITSDLQNNDGKLSMPVIYSDETNNRLGAGLGTPSPTLMAEKLNPYTNGVAASFPPGIDPFDGFMRYAAENLETPMGNIVDYHSLEHYYGPQHPLSPYHSSKEGKSLQGNPYAESFGYNGIVETSNSPHLPPPPPGFDGPQSYGEDGGPGSILNHSGRGGFRYPNNPVGRRPGGPRNSSHNPVKPTQEHGIDHFDAPSPGHDAAPPKPRPHLTDPALYEEDHGYRNPPFEPQQGPQPYGDNHHTPSFKQPSSAVSTGLDSFRNGPPIPQYHSPAPSDLEVFEEGPPASHPPIPPLLQNNLQPSPQEVENNDGGDDAIWGILDLAEMLEKGQLPGHKSNSNTSPMTPGIGNSPKGDRVVVPIFTRPPPPRSGSPTDDGDGPPADHDTSPPHLPPPNSNTQKGGFPLEDRAPTANGSFDYDDHPGTNSRPSTYGGLGESQEASDYGDEYTKK